MKTIYVLDTNVLLQDPFAMFAFHEHEIVIPAVVLEEIDSKKRYMDEIGRNARQVARLLDTLRERGKIHEGVVLDSGGRVRVELNHRSLDELNDYFIEVTNDHRILAVAYNIQREQRERNAHPVVLVSKDALMRVKADVLGLKSEDFLNDRIVQFDHMYKGYEERFVTGEKLDSLYEKKRIPTNEIVTGDFLPHQFLVLKDATGSSASAIAKVNQDATKVELLKNKSLEAIWGIKPRNVQQRMAMELLLRDDLPLVTLVGKAGTGKTLLSLAAGLSQTEDHHMYNKLLVTRPVIPVGKDIGFLPGEKEEKLRPWMQPIYDNLEYLFNTKRSEELEKILAGMGSIQVEALTYIRGRSIPDQFIIIDEAQNLTKHEAKTILTRVGEGSKVVLMGDPKQIDHPYLDEYSNGLTYVVEQLKTLSLSGHVKLEKGERSSFAQLAADWL
ncbi:PhoH family protein [Texcoconibacillus texcoconensis]|uniref:PhoH-like ATPase n=1 Tax=Texcoconibacillus texcoconensis TaxID=1095777 RepID=A0A840QLI7_9BACI|nr:PhoH-like ATPase [Texcoconibacillus texcoconensis]